jgi:hypothetical protein
MPTSAIRKSIIAGLALFVKALKKMKRQKGLVLQ